ncbi:hypothetical protein [Streptomyces sp. NPDC059564]|uniref:hypothetical protein n=1 Tax=Streptomyces sp. NPDC059564 TaxID=3346865 RepID=UPI0036ADB07B
MRTTLVRRTVLTASAVSLALLATACGAGKADTKADAKPEPRPSAPSSAAPAAKGKTDSELSALLVTQADVPDHVEAKDVAKKASEDQGNAGTVDKPECKALVDAYTQRKIGTPTGTALTALAAKPKELGPNATEEEKAAAIMGALTTTTTVTGLTSYDGKGAEEMVASVKAAGTACPAGFSVTAGSDVTKFDSVKPGQSASVGDEAVSLVLTMDLEDGDKGTILLNVVRKANTVATFSSISFGGKTEFPKTLIGAQAKKLG